MPSRALSAFVVIAGVLAGCAARTTPRIRVARDLGCIADQTDVFRLSEHRWRVSGCGREAIYACSGNAQYAVRDCWREGDIYAAGEASEPQAAPPQEISGR